MRTLRTALLAPAIVAALGIPAGAAHRKRHVTEAPADDAAEALRDTSDARDAHDPHPALDHRDDAEDELAEAPRIQRHAVRISEPDSDWHLGVSAGADFPLDAINVGLVVEAPGGVWLSSSVGFRSDVFLGRIDEGSASANALLQAAVQDSRVWRTHLAYRPWKSHGFYTSLGYSLIQFGGALSTADVASVVGGQMLPAGIGGTGPLAHVSSTLHTLDVEAGWEWSTARRFRFRTAVGAGFLLAASTALQIDASSGLGFLPGPLMDQLLAPLERTGVSAMQSALQQASPLFMASMQLQINVL